jgi:hypothetical protein
VYDHFRRTEENRVPGLIPLSIDAGSGAFYGCTSPAPDLFFLANSSGSILVFITLSTNHPDLLFFYCSFIMLTAEYSIGAMADSYYEYLLKLAHATKENAFMDMWKESAQSILNYIVTTSPSGKFTYFPKVQIERGGYSYKGNYFEELVSFPFHIFYIFPQSVWERELNNSKQKN